ncbi:uncharacterized protein ASCRUDRAFT_70392 [Ascoidea rubescens DSM 1968]|uniref:Uncharacterized protein n=1 Tax=Ascoidea rubescens DSM 1968 TaxID=1344418 RepID=A0A1D2VHP4_9ASCO|nr:hypothetical protein ASCRUDRAFT_70392 [Ascoidea rubescens DSM 1968]ODV61184.1 hypothetical protein ASCRUDRAFT_70392 [Ascoidea rubescens DSM 1968]
MSGIMNKIQNKLSDKNDHTHETHDTHHDTLHDSTHTTKPSKYDQQFSTTDKYDATTGFNGSTTQPSHNKKDWNNPSTNAGSSGVGVLGNQGLNTGSNHKYDPTNKVHQSQRTNDIPTQYGAGSTNIQPDVLGGQNDQYNNNLLGQKNARTSNQDAYGQPQGRTTRSQKANYQKDLDDVQRHM